MDLHLPFATAMKVSTLSTLRAEVELRWQFLDLQGVPTPNVSIVDLVLKVAKQTSKDSCSLPGSGSFHTAQCMGWQIASGRGQRCHQGGC